MNRRNFIRNAAGLLVAAPMVVRSESIMRVKPLVLAPAGMDHRLDVAAYLDPIGYEFRVYGRPAWMLAQALQDARQKQVTEPDWPALMERMGRIPLAEVARLAPAAKSGATAAVDKDRWDLLDPAELKNRIHWYAVK